MHPKKLLDQYQLTPRKSLGQNFLFDNSILSRIVEAAELTDRDSVIEIGPGVGTLTRHLAAVAGQVLAIELDENLLPILKTELGAYPNVELLHGDVLNTEPGDHFPSGYHVVANVPYYITGAILRHFLSAAIKPIQMVLTIQSEVAERLTAQPGNMSVLSVIVQYYAQVSYLFSIKAGAFWPRPEVDSATVKISLWPSRSLHGVEEEIFFDLIKLGFSQKRKQLRNNLRRAGYSRDQLTQALLDAGIEGNRRAETLSVEEWLILYEKLRFS